jgi:signal transduction histidine kinase
MTDTLTSLNAQLTSARDRAEGASKAKDQFLANMSHELRTPLNGIMGMTTLLRDTPMSEEQREFLEIIDGSSASLLTIVNDVLDFAKIDAGALAVESAPFDVRACFEHTRRLLGPLADARRLELVYDIDPALPARLVGDEMRLRQILLNLGSNAIKFTSSGSVCVRARAGEGDTSAQVLLQVEVIDTGIGIAKDRQAAIFEPFVQADGSTTRRYGGTGLGLTICARLIGLMDGAISVTSEPGAGTTFAFFVRMARTGEPDVEQPAPVPVRTRATR